MMLRNDCESVENAIGRRLVETMVSGGVRPFHPTGAPRRASATGTGLFLVKPAIAVSDREAPSRSGKIKAFGEAKLKATVPTTSKGGPEVAGYPRRRAISVRNAEEQGRREALLGLMAAMGPLLCIGHAALVWLKVV